jgi:hypothetical protein
MCGRKNNVEIKVNLDEFNKLLDSIIDLIENYGKHEDPNSICVIHLDEMRRRQQIVIDAVKTFRPSYIQKTSFSGVSSE